MVDQNNVIRLTERTKTIRSHCLSDATALFTAYKWDWQKDLRVTSIKRLSTIITGLSVALLYISNCDQDIALEKIRLSTEKNIETEHYLETYEVFLKIGFSSSLFFLVESVIKRYLQFLDITAYKKARGIRSICNCLLDEKLERDTVKFDCQVFDFLRLIRNTLHNNGTHLPQSHREKDIEVNYKGTTYGFTDRTRLDFVTWDLLLDITDDMRALLLHIANNKTIREIQGTIPDILAVHPQNYPYFFIE